MYAYSVLAARSQLLSLKPLWSLLSIRFDLWYIRMIDIFRFYWFYITLKFEIFAYSIFYGHNSYLDFCRVVVSLTHFMFPFWYLSKYIVFILYQQMALYAILIKFWMLTLTNIFRGKQWLLLNMASYFMNVFL